MQRKKRKRNSGGDHDEEDEKQHVANSQEEFDLFAESNSIQEPPQKRMRLEAEPIATPSKPSKPANLFSITPAISTPYIQRSNKVKNMCTLPPFLPPKGPISDDWRDTRRKNNTKKDLKNLVHGTEQEWQRALDMRWKDHIKSATKIVRAVWGGDDIETYRKTLSNYLKNGYRYTWQIPKAGRKPALGIVGDSALAGFANYKAYYGQTLNDDDINEAAANMYNKLNGVDPNKIDLTTDGPPVIAGKVAMGKNFAKRVRKCYPNANHRKMQHLTHAKKKACPSIQQGQKNLGKALEKVGYKEKNGDIKPYCLSRVYVGDEVGGRTKNKSKKGTTFNCIPGVKMVPWSSKAPDPKHVTLLPFVSLEGTFLKPICVVPNKYHIGDYILKAGEVGWKGAHYCTNETGSGYIHFTVFYAAFQRMLDDGVFGGWLNIETGIYYPKPCIEAPIIFLLDGHSSRYVDPTQITSLYEQG